MNLVIFACLTTALVLFVISGNAAEEKTCKAILSDLTKRQMGGIAACTKTMKFKNGKDKAAKMNCVLKCVMQNEGLLSAEGQMTEASVEALINKEFPTSLIPTVKPLFMNCVQTTAGSLDPTEEFCKSYDALIKCLMGAIGSMCPK